MEETKEKDGALPPPEGTHYEILVRLFVASEPPNKLLGEDVVTILATRNVADLRAAIRSKFQHSVLKDRDAAELIVTPTGNGIPLALTMKLWKVSFSLVEGELPQAFVYVPMRKADHKQNRAQCYRSLPFDPNFSSQIPFEARVPTATRAGIIAYINENHLEPCAVSLFAPPGFGKTVVGVDAARLAQCAYTRVAFSRTGMCLSLIREYKKVIAGLPSKMTTQDLLLALEPISQSFVAHAINRAAEHTQFNDQLVELLSIGFSVFPQPGIALADACKQLRHKLLLHLDEVNEFMVPIYFRRKLVTEFVEHGEYYSYCLISLSIAISEALSACQHLRVMFTGTTIPEAHMIKFTTALKIVNVETPRESTSDFVKQVVDYFLDLSHLNPDFVNHLYTELAGCKRSVQWFLFYIDTNFSSIRGDELTEQHFERAVAAAREPFCVQAAGNLRTQLAASDALLAFVFYQQYGGAIVQESGRTIGISFPTDMIPKEWYQWNASGALHLRFALDFTSAILQWPYPFMVTFLQRNAGIVASANKDLLRSFLLCCVAQPDTMPGLAFQFAVAQELTNCRSPLILDLTAKFRAKFRKNFAPIELVPTMQLFTVPTELPPTATAMCNVFMVADKYNPEPKYVDVAVPIHQAKEDGQWVQSHRVLLEVKRKNGATDLWADCRLFFDQCEKSGAKDDLFVFLSYFPFTKEYESKGGKNVHKVEEFLKKPNFVVVEGPEAFAKCTFPFDRLVSSGVANDIFTFRKNLLAPLEAFFGGKPEEKEGDEHSGL